MPRRESKFNLGGTNPKLCKDSLPEYSIVMADVCDNSVALEVVPEFLGPGHSLLRCDVDHDSPKATKQHQCIVGGHFARGLDTSQYFVHVSCRRSSCPGHVVIESCHATLDVLLWKSADTSVILVSMEQRLKYMNRLRNCCFEVPQLQSIAWQERQMRESC